MGLFSGLTNFVSDIFGGSPSGGSSGGTASADALSRLAQEYWKQSAGVRDPFLSQMSQFMTQGWDPTTSAMWDPLKANVESQFQTAQNDIKSQLPAGGNLLESLADTSTAKANTLSGLAGNMIQDMYNKAYGISTGSPQQSMSGLTGAGSLYNQAYSGNAQNQMANVAGLGGLMGLGSGLGSGLGALGGLGSSLAGLFGSGGLFFSSRDYKDDIESIPEGKALDVLSKIRPVSYKYKPEFGGEDALGVIAEEVEKVLPVAVKHKAIGGKNYTMVDYMALVPLLVKGLQEQQKQIDALA